MRMSTTATLVIALMVATAVGLYAYFKRVGWL
jgi:hypothetical protein